MSQFLLFALIASSSLVVGSLIATFFKLKQKSIAAIMAFGSGALICALTFGLVDEAFQYGGLLPTLVGFFIGGMVFILGDYIIHLGGGRKHRRHQLFESKRDISGFAITFGAVLDAIPESIALGILIFNGKSAGLLMLIGIIFNNIPESISAYPGLRKEGFNRFKINVIWTIVAVISFLVSIIGYTFLSHINPIGLALIESFAGGSILAMLATAMIPEAYEKGGIINTYLTVLGFITAYAFFRL